MRIGDVERVAKAVLAQSGPTVAGSTSWWRNSAKELAAGFLELLAEHRSIEVVQLRARLEEVELTLNDLRADLRSAVADLERKADR